ncbi:MAG: gamma-glutamyl-gamma-aminobutyrate hydrolase family protein, partial [Planctomycetota bacterium]
DLRTSRYPALLPIHFAQETEERLHGVELERATRLLDLLGPEPLETNSRHHQGVDEVPPGLLISARAVDGVIEGLETEGERFLVAVQWHPEEHRDEARHLRLFEALVRAARIRTEAAGNR